MPDNVTDREIKEKLSSNKWAKVLLSLAILMVIVLGMIRLASRGSNILGIFGFYIVAWLVVVPLSAASIICRILKFLRYQSFLYIFLGVGNLALAAGGIYFGIGNSPSNWIWLLAYWISAVFAVLMLGEALVLRPGSSDN